MLIVPSLLVSLWFGLACHRHLLRRTCSRCTMSFMSTGYSLEHAANSPTTPPYRLYRFFDPDEDENTRRDPYVCRPVIFVPGNQGSYRQARTIGYWLATHQPEDGECYALYTVDLLEQWSVVSNRVLRAQSEFLRSCLDHVRGRHKEQQLVMVGHSMGSVVARLALSGQPSLPPVKLISLAAPMDCPALSLDRRSPTIDYSFPAASVKSVSYSCGFADVQVMPFASSPDGSRLNCETTPMVWASPEHQAIVWVHQVVEHVCRSIIQ